MRAAHDRGPATQTDHCGADLVAAMTGADPATVKVNVKAHDGTGLVFSNESDSAPEDSSGSASRQRRA
jgi:hypothetical protein